MKKWEKEILANKTKSEHSTILQIKKTYKYALEEVKQKVAVLQAKEQTQSVIYQLKYQEELEKQLQEVYDKLYNNYYGTVDEYLKDCYEDGFYSTMYSLNQQGIPVVLPMNQAEIIQMTSVASDGMKLSDKIYSDTQELTQISKQEISRGLATGASYIDIARTLEARSDASYKQAKRIVSTEAHRVQEEVQYKTMQKAKDKGADVVKQWDSTIDRKTRPHHVELDGQLRELDQPFKIPSTGATAQYPGGFGIAKEDIHCRCVSLQRARWALDQSEVEKAVGDLDGMTDSQLDALASKFGVTKEELIQKSNGIIENDGSINHRIQAKSYNEFKKKYQKKVQTKTEKLQNKLDVAQNEYNSILSKYKDKSDLLLYGNVDDLANAGTLQKQIKDLQTQLGIVPATTAKAATTATATTASVDDVMKKAKKFPNPQEADSFHRPNTEAVWNDLSKNEQRALYKYTGSSYSDMNRALRSGKGDYSNLADSTISKYIKDATTGLEKSKLTEDVWVRRGVSVDGIEGLTGISKSQLSDVAVQQSLIGQRVTEYGFMSTGVAEGAGFSGINLEVCLPKGTQAIYAEPFSNFGGTNTSGTWDGKQTSSYIGGEAEVIVQRNSTFEIKEVKTDSSGYITDIVLLLVEQSH